MTNPFEAELAKRQGAQAGLEGPPPQQLSAPQSAPNSGGNPFKAELSRRGLDATPSLSSLQNTGQPIREGLTDANKIIAETVGGVGEILNAPGNALYKATNRAGLTNVRTDPEAGLFPTKKEVKEGFEDVGIDVTPKLDAERTPSERAAGAAGKVIGAGATFLAPGTAAVKAGASGKGALGFLGPIGQQFVKNPSAFAATEVGTLAGSAQGAAAAELLFPGSDTAKFVGEVAGGFVNPAAAMAKAGPKAAGAIGRAASTFTRGGREAAASKVLQNMAIEAGEDPKVLAAALRKTDVVPNSLSSGAKTGSEAMLRLEASVARDNAKFQRTNQASTDDAFERIRTSIDDMAASGDPEAVRIASKLRQQNFDNLLDGRIRSAQNQAMETAARVSGPGKAASSARVEKVLRNALDEARGAERALWNEVPKDIPVQINPDGPLTAAVKEARTRLLDEEILPFDRTLNRIMEAGSNSGELITLRSRLLDNARKLRSERDYGKAAIASDLAEAVRKQMDDVGNPAFDEARAFSRTLNEKFTQSFAGDALRSDPAGASRMLPEVVLDRAFAGGGGGSSVRFRQLEEAGDFADAQGGNFLFRDAVRSEQEAFLRSAAEETMTDGVVNTTKLQTFMTRNAETLKRFPGVAADLQDANSAAKVLKQVENLNASASKIVRQKATFSKVLDVEDATAVVSKAISGREPAREIGQLSRLARKSGPSAVAGLRTSIIDDAVSRATSAKGLDFQKLDDALSKPVSRGGPSAYGMISSNQLMKNEELVRLKSLVSRAAQIEKNVATRFLKEELVESPDAITDLVIRIAGARVGARAAEGGAAGSSLVAASAGSRFLRGILEKVPASRTQDVLIEAAQNPQFAAKLLEKPKTEAARRRIGKQLNVFLLQAGIIAEDGQDEQSK